ncbi:FAD-dependent oxidoreductase [Gramella sp. GC03-9]|uniref:FAD-dependent oxidoreductase n=1 Tax=Christiangramia oceanisediminis TaxID=2920386 RepID=A0A9X2I1Q6_9FLAO|nr:FAD-dependent oxidoreductase [Gramella oceanisediminis]MCP9199040.1 FAD-dependent oxidoreductase [Gramella oceanisediminis]
MDFDVLIIGGGAAGLSCALVIGSAMENPYAENKKAGIILHQKASHLNSALLNNAFGIAPGTSGMDVLSSAVSQLEELYPKLQRIEKEKVKEIQEIEGGYRVITNKKEYSAAKVVLTIGYNSPFRIKGLEAYLIPHKKAKPTKNRVQLKNDDHLVKPGLYVAGTLAGWRSQVVIASGSGASVATDILTDWNKGEHTKVHDKLA